MDAIDLHKILDDENRKLSLDELKQVIYELKQEAIERTYELQAEDGYLANKDLLIVESQAKEEAYLIVLKLLKRYDKTKREHIPTAPIPKYCIGDTVWLIEFDYSVQSYPTKRAVSYTVEKVFISKTKVTYRLKGKKYRHEEQCMFPDKKTAENIMKGKYKF